MNYQAKFEDIKLEAQRVKERAGKPDEYVIRIENGKKNFTHIPFFSDARLDKEPKFLLLAFRNILMNAQTGRMAPAQFLDHMNLLPDAKGRMMYEMMRETTERLDTVIELKSSNTWFEMAMRMQQAGVVPPMREI